MPEARKEMPDTACWHRVATSYLAEFQNGLYSGSTQRVTSGHLVVTRVTFFHSYESFPQSMFSMALLGFVMCQKHLLVVFFWHVSQTATVLGRVWGVVWGNEWSGKSGLKCHSYRETLAMKM